MESIYYNPSQAASIGGIRPLVRESGVNKKDVRNWLIAQDT